MSREASSSKGTTRAPQGATSSRGTRGTLSSSSPCMPYAAIAWKLGLQCCV